VGGAVGGAIIGFEKVDQVGGIFLGGILGGICGGIASAGSCIANYDIDVETFHNYGQHKNEDNSYLWGLFLLTFPHVVGKLSYDIGNLGRKLIYNDRKSYQDINALGEALQPAEFFTYEEKT